MCSSDLESSLLADTRNHAMGWLKALLEPGHSRPVRSSLGSARSVALLACLVLGGCVSLERVPGPFENTPPVSLPRTHDGSSTEIDGRVTSSPETEQEAARKEIGFVRPGTGVFTRPGRAARSVPTDSDAGRFTLNFQDTDLLEVVKVILTDLVPANYVVDPAVQGRVTLQTSKPLPPEALIPTLEML